MSRVRSEIVAPEAIGPVELRTKSLWIVPELWKTQNARFPTSSLDALRTRAHTLHRRTHLLNDQDKKRRKEIRKGIACVRGDIARYYQPSPEWPVFKRFSLAAFQRSVTEADGSVDAENAPTDPCKTTERFCTSSHTPHQHFPFQKNPRPEPLRIGGQLPTDSAEEAKTLRRHSRSISESWERRHACLQPQPPVGANTHSGPGAAHQTA